MILGQQAGYMKYPCFICLWDSRDKNQHYKKKIWPLRRSLKAGDPNVSKNPLIGSEKVLLPPLHIKLRIMKQFVKALYTQYLVNRLPCLTDAKIKGGIFVGTQIRELMKTTQFEDVMTNVEKMLGSASKKQSKNSQATKNQVIMTNQSIICLKAFKSQAAT